MPYTMNRNDLMGLVAKIGAETHEKGDELFFKYCPICGGGGDRDKDTFSVNIKTGVYHCFRASCGANGHFVQLARRFDYPLVFDNMKAPAKKKYREMPQRPVKAADVAITYLKGRGISDDVTRKYQIAARKDQPKTIVFPFYDHNGKLICAKYRKTDFVAGRDKCKEWFESGTEPILFGENHCTPGKPLVITEGQIDSLSVAEAGIENALSVPNGAQGMTWIENCWDFLQQYSEIIVFGDCEKGKVTLAEDINRRCSAQKIRVVQQEDYLGEKDANAILQKYGAEAIRQAIQNAKEMPIERIEELADVKTIDLYSMEKVETGIVPIDKVIGGLYFGQVAAITGKRGEGKSTLVSQILVESLDQGYSILAYSGELTDYHFKRWMDFQAAGGDHVMTRYGKYDDVEYFIQDGIVEQINDWYRGRAFVYDNKVVSDDDETKQLLDTIEKAIQRYGVRVISIDNMMTAMDVDLQNDLYRAQSKFVKRLKEIAVKYNVLILLVAHPKKTQQDIQNDDVSGSSDITNRVDLVLAYSRDRKADAEHPINQCTHANLTVLKNRLTGRLAMGDGKIPLVYSEKTKRVIAVDSTGDKKYGWEAKASEQIDYNALDLPF